MYPEAVLNFMKKDGANCMKKLEDRFDNKPEATQEMETRRRKKSMLRKCKAKYSVACVAPSIPRGQGGQIF